jgi:uncharacterized protein YecT (DUF1311 family)
MLDQGNSNNTQLWVAIMGLIAALGGAVIANWEKLSPRPIVYLSAPTPAATTSSSSSDSTSPTEDKRVTIHELRDPLPRQQRLPSLGPSFNCAKATYPSERLVCSSSELAVLDLAMANAYRDAMAQLREKERKTALRDSQNRWLRTTRETCAGADCLSDIYLQRIGELKAVQR